MTKLTQKRVAIDSEWDGDTLLSVQIAVDDRRIVVLNNRFQEQITTSRSRDDIEIVWAPLDDDIDLSELLGIDLVDRELVLFYSPKDIEHLIGTQKALEFYNWIEQKRCLKISNPNPWKVKLHDLKGWTNGTLKDLAEAVNVNMSSKTSLDDYKDQMTIALVEHTKEFLDYAIEDAEKLLEIDGKFRSMISNISRDQLGVKISQLEIPHTIGSLITHLFEKWINSQLSEDGQLAIRRLGILDVNYPKYQREVVKFNERNDNLKVLKDLHYAYLGYSQAGIDYFAHQNSTIAFNALVLGGRCRNEHPEEFQARNTADADLTGCYGQGLVSFTYPIGLPETIGFSPNETRLSLKDWLEQYESELVPGLWQAIVETNEPLSFHQDLLYSKITDLKTINKAVYSWDDTIGYVEDEVSHVEGEFVMIRKELKNAVLTHESLKVLRAVMSDREWSEFRSKVQIVTACWYPRSERCRSERTWSHAINNRDQVLKFDKNCRAIADYRSRTWYGLPIEDFLGPLLDRRKETKKLKKTDPSMAAEDKLLKLLINALYGVLASPYFSIGNAIVANNITDKARCGTWMMAKALGFRQSITDGGFYTPGTVWNYVEYKPSMNILATGEGKRLRLVPMGGIGWIEAFKEFEKSTPKEVGECLDDLATEHVKQFWDPYGLKLPFEIEHKGEHTAHVAAYWNKAHYAFRTLWGEDHYKVRGCKRYENELREAPIYKLLEAILDGLDCCPDDLAYDHFELLKVGKWKEAIQSAGYENIKELMPGDELVTQRIQRWNNAHMPVDTLKDWEKRSARKAYHRGQPVEWFERHRTKGIKYMHARMMNNRLKK